MTPVTTKNYVRINKRTARRLYATGAANLYFCPVNLNPESPWGLLYGPVSRETDFDNHVHTFEIYNCTGRETGRYAAFYVSRAWWDALRAVNAAFVPTDAQLATLAATAHKGVENHD